LKKISDAVMEIITGHHMLNFGFYHRLLNLSQVARFINPLVEARTHKEVRDTAVLMSLSRLQSKLASAEASGSSYQPLFLDKINVQTGLCSFTVFKTRVILKELNRLFTKIRNKDGFITITEGINEVTTIIGNEDYFFATEMISEKLRYVYRDIASVGVKFPDEILGSPGLIYQMLQQLAVQNINVIEVASTATELNIYVKEEDVRLAFDSLYRRFVQRTQD